MKHMKTVKIRQQV